MSCTWHLQPSTPVNSTCASSAFPAEISELRAQQILHQKQKLLSGLSPLPYEESRPPQSAPVLHQRHVSPEVPPTSCFSGSFTSPDPSCDFSQNDVPFEFPVEVERMVSDLCSSSKDGSCKYDDLGGLGLGLGLEYGGLRLQVANSIPVPPTPTRGPTTPAKQRSPFSILQVPQQVQVPLEAPAPPSFLAQRAAHTLGHTLTPIGLPVGATSLGQGSPGLDFGESAPTAAPPSVPYFPDGYLNSSQGDHACKPCETGPVSGSVLPAFPLPDGALSFRELVIKGCLELENILRVHKQHSYIGDLLTFCHAIRESAATAAGGEFDSPSDETRALIIAFFRLVSCWLGLFPCQQELHSALSAFRDWQHASRKVIIAILKRVPVLRERIEGDANPWKAPQTQAHSQALGRQVWPKSQNKNFNKSPNKLGLAKGQSKCSSKDWCEPGLFPKADRGSPRGAHWRAEDSSLGLDPGIGGVGGTLGTAARPIHPGDKWKLPDNTPSFTVESTFPGSSHPFQEGMTKDGQVGPGGPGTSRGTRWCGAGESATKVRQAGLAGLAGRLSVSVRFDLDGTEEVHEGAYMKPGCYDVPRRHPAPPANPSALPSLPANCVAPMGPTVGPTACVPLSPVLTPAAVLPPEPPVPPPLLSETTWQAALASAETLCRALQCNEGMTNSIWETEGVAPAEDGMADRVVNAAANAAAKGEAAKCAVNVAGGGSTAADGDVHGHFTCTADAAVNATVNTAVNVAATVYTPGEDGAIEAPRPCPRPSPRPRQWLPLSHALSEMEATAQSASPAPAPTLEGRFESRARTKKGKNRSGCGSGPAGGRTICRSHSWSRSSSSSCQAHVGPKGILDALPDLEEAKSIASLDASGLKVSGEVRAPGARGLEKALDDLLEEQHGDTSTAQVHADAAPQDEESTSADSEGTDQEAQDVAEAATPALVQSVVSDALVGQEAGPHRHEG